MQYTCDKEMNIQPASEPRRTMKDVIQDTKAVLAEAGLMIADTNLQMFGYNPIGDGTVSKAKEESKCMNDDVQIINQQARMILSMFSELRKAMI